MPTLGEWESLSLFHEPQFREARDEGVSFCKRVEEEASAGLLAEQNVSLIRIDWKGGWW
jgi:hypothetical protein